MTMGLSSAYLAELRTHWRVLLAAFIGMGFGLSLSGFTAALFGPPLIAEFGWTRSQFALVSTGAIVMLFVLPFAGRAADRFGVRRVAAIGIIAIPAVDLGLSAMSGSFAQFFALSTLKVAMGAMVSGTIYSSLIAQRFVAARGFAFAVIMTAPALVAAVTTPAFAAVIAEYGWRSGYLASAAVTLIGGLAALTIIPAHVSRPHRIGNSMRADFALVSRQPVFWLIFGGMFLVNLPSALGAAQMNVMALGMGASAGVAVTMISAYASGIVIGRFVCGVALDRLPAHLVAAALLSLPALGFFALWSDFDMAWFLIVAMAMVGLAQGAEGDVAAYLVARHFDIRTYGFVMGMVSSGLSAASSVGALMLSVSLRGNDDFGPFVLFCGVITLVGAMLFLLLGRGPPASTDQIRDSREHT